MLHNTDVTYLLLNTKPRIQYQQSQIFFRGIIIKVSKVNQLCGLEESGQRLENVDQTHLVLASGKQASATKKSQFDQQASANQVLPGGPNYQVQPEFFSSENAVKYFVEVGVG